MTNEHVADRAAFLAALPDEDPERKMADEHARSCVSCREAMQEGTRLVALLHRALPLQSPPREAKRTTLTIMTDEVAANDREIDRDGEGEREGMSPVAWASAAAVLVAWLFQLSVGGGFHPDLPHLAVSLSMLAIAVAGVILMRGKERLATAIIVATSGLFAYVSGSATGLDVGIGIRCSFRELWAAGITWAIVAWVARRRRLPFRARWHVTALVASGALAAHAGQHLACEVPASGAHLLVFHFGAVVLATVLAAVAAGRRPPVLLAGG